MALTPASYRDETFSCARSCPPPDALRRLFARIGTAEDHTTAIWLHVKTRKTAQSAVNRAAQMIERAVVRPKQPHLFDVHRGAMFLNCAMGLQNTYGTRIRCRIDCAK